LEALLADPARIDTEDIRSSLPDPALAAAFLERLPADDPDLVPVLAAVREGFQEKPVQKAARRAAFRFEQRGVQVPPGDAREERAVLRSPGPDAGEAFAMLSPVDSVGARGVLLGIPRPTRGMELAVALTSDENGILQFAGGTFSKKKVLGARDDFQADFSHAVPAPPEHAVAVLEQAHQAKPGAPGSADYLRARPWILDRITPSEESPARGLIPDEEVTGRPFTDSMAARLLDHDILAFWMADLRDTRSLADQIREVEESPIVLSEDQKERRVDEIVRTWIRDQFTEEKRARIAHRLEETAYVFHRLGEEETGRLARVAARSLMDGEPSLDVHPFLRALTARTLAVFQAGVRDGTQEGTGDEGPEEGGGPSLIIP
jgi:hypothetical protein